MAGASLNGGTVERADAGERRGDGSEVRRAFDALCTEFPQLLEAAAA